MTLEPVHVVIIGQGAAGLAAAVAAVDEAKLRGTTAHVTILERANEVHAGGNTRWSPSNMRMRSVDQVAPGFEADMHAAARGRSDRAYFRRLATDAPDAARWLKSLGMTFHSPPYYLSVGPPRIQPVGGGAAVLAALSRAAKGAGVMTHYECTASRLILDPWDAVAGVEVRTADDQIERIAADAVVIAAGGFEGDREMLREHFGPGGETLQAISPGTVFNTGAGIRMALEIGAQKSGDWQGMHIEPVDPRSRQSAPVVLVYPYGIVVDRDGKRFYDEGAGLMHETWEDLARTIHFETPGRIAYAILDARLFDIDGYERAIRSEVPPIKADSIEALARAAGIDANGLAATVHAFNAAARGDPTRFDATRADGLATAALTPPKSNWACAIERAPFIAYPLVGAIAYTFGGIATNDDTQVLGRHSPIRGLYAAGEVTGHFYGTAPNSVAVMRALVFGRIAGRNAVRDRA